VSHSGHDALCAGEAALEIDRHVAAAHALGWPRGRPAGAAAGLSVEPNYGQIGLPQRGAGDRNCIDRMGLAWVAVAVPDARHQARRNQHGRLASQQEIDLQATRDGSIFSRVEPPPKPKRVKPTCWGQVTPGNLMDPVDVSSADFESLAVPMEW
jgi:hypothetical protein